MKVTAAMIHRDIRLKGLLMRLFAKPISEGRSRKNLAKLAKRNDSFFPAFAQMEKIHISRSDGSKMRTLILKPQNAKANLPGVLFLHGGGYIGGSPEEKIWFAERLIAMEECVVVSPDYSLAPYRPYPAAVEDAYLALLWLRDNAAKLGANLDQLFVVGESAGGGLAASLAIYARDRGEVNVAFQMPLFPMLDDQMQTDSMRDNNAPIWNEKSNRVAWQLYLGDLFGNPEVPAYAAPVRLADFDGLPPAYTYVGTIDPFYDETRIYFEKLQAAGIEANIDFYEGCFHAFDEVAANTDIAKRCNENIKVAFRHACKTYFASQSRDSII